MNRINFVLLALMVLLPLALCDTCMSCKKLNDVCNPNNDSCGGKSTCAATADGSYKCVALPDKGGDCTITKLCLNGYSCNPTSNTCTAEYYLGSEEKCDPSSSNQCTKGLTCTLGVCINLKHSECNTDSMCKYNERCGSYGRCKHPAADGADCEISGDCGFNSFCNPTFKKCAAKFSTASGGNCSNEIIECNNSQNLVCIKGTCQSKNIISNTKCNSSNDCDFGLHQEVLCACESNTSPYKGICRISFDTSYVSNSSLSDFESCMAKNKCPRVDHPNVPGACAKQCNDPREKMEVQLCINDGSILSRNFIFTFVLVVALATLLL